jgi:AcrR family transcriptional regulator
MAESFRRLESYSDWKDSASERCEATMPRIEDVPSAPSDEGGLARAIVRLGGELVGQKLADAGGARAQVTQVAEGLRERKKRQMRQQISDTATGMFLERGFDTVRVAEVAAACGVSEKTVYNYFPTKESLLFDREDDTAAAIARALGPGSDRVSPVESAVRVIAEDVEQMYAAFAEHGTELRMMLRFAELVESTPSLRAAQQDMNERLVQRAAEALAARAGVDPAEPEPQIAASAIVGLWRVQYQAMRRQAAAGVTPAVARERVIADVRRAARLIDTGLWSFVLTHGVAGRKDVRAAMEAANEARRQAKESIKHARTAWREVMTEMHQLAHEERHRAQQLAREERQRVAREARQRAHRGPRG